MFQKKVLKVSKVIQSKIVYSSYALLQIEMDLEWSIRRFKYA